MERDPVTRDDVRHVATLARIELDDDEIDTYVDQFEDILAAFDAIDEVPAVDAEEDLENVMRPDERRDGLGQEAALQNAPEHEDGYFKGPPVS